MPIRLFSATVMMFALIIFGKAGAVTASESELLLVQPDSSTEILDSAVNNLRSLAFPPEIQESIQAFQGEAESHASGIVPLAPALASAVSDVVAKEPSDARLSHHSRGLAAVPDGVHVADFYVGSEDSHAELILTLVDVGAQGIETPQEVARATMVPGESGQLEVAYHDNAGQSGSYTILSSELNYCGGSCTTATFLVGGLLHLACSPVGIAPAGWACYTGSYMLITSMASNCNIEKTCQGQVPAVLHDPTLNCVKTRCSFGFQVTAGKRLATTNPVSGNIYWMRNYFSDYSYDTWSDDSVRLVRQFLGYYTYKTYETVTGGPAGYVECTTHVQVDASIYWQNGTHDFWKIRAPKDHDSPCKY